MEVRVDAPADAAPANQPEPIDSVTIAIARALEHRPTTMSIGDVNALVTEISAGGQSLVRVESRCHVDFRRQIYRGAAPG